MHVIAEVCMHVLYAATCICASVCVCVFAWTHLSSVAEHCARTDRSRAPASSNTERALSNTYSSTSNRFSVSSQPDSTNDKSQVISKSHKNLSIKKFNFDVTGKRYQTCVRIDGVT